jgi:hypothetical protein
VWNFFMQYWELSLLLLTWLGVGMVAARRRSDWRRRRFDEQVNFSLNYLETQPDGSECLLLRTLLEDSARRVWLNEWGVRCVQRAAQLTDREHPFLAIDSDRDRDQILRGVLNVLAERFAETYLARSLGLPVQSDRFLFGLTWERYGDVHSHKFRVMVIRPRDLEHLFESGAVERVRFERASHEPRLETLRELHRLWRSTDPGERARIGSVELGVLGGLQPLEG